MSAELVSGLDFLVFIVYLCRSEVLPNQIMIFENLKGAANIDFEGLKLGQIRT